MGETALDALARALVEPMPRRRAVRLLGATLVAVAVPGMRAPSAAARRRAACDAGCGADVRACPKVVNLGTGPPVCCGAPARRYSCEGTIFEPVCVDGCKGPNYIPCTGKKDRDGCSLFACCKRPEFIGCVDGECIPNCRWPNPQSGMFQCGKTCCQPGEICKNGRCQDCPGKNSCRPAKRGDAECCPKGTTCCRNDTSADCCGPDQACRAAKRKKATCVCKKGAKCGTNCCDRGEKCCNGEECCGAGEVCCGGVSCCKNCCGGNICCDTDEWCFYKNTGTIFNVPTCKSTCSPGNRCGEQCCGTGFECKNGRCAPVP